MCKQQKPGCITAQYHDVCSAHYYKTTFLRYLGCLGFLKVFFSGVSPKESLWCRFLHEKKWFRYIHYSLLLFPRCGMIEHHRKRMLACAVLDSLNGLLTKSDNHHSDIIYLQWRLSVWACVCL